MKSVRFKLVVLTQETLKEFIEDGQSHAQIQAYTDSFCLFISIKRKFTEEEIKKQLETLLDKNNKLTFIDKSQIIAAISCSLPVVSSFIFEETSLLDSKIAFLPSIIADTVTFLYFFYYVFGCFSFFFVVF